MSLTPNVLLFLQAEPSRTGPGMSLFFLQMLAFVAIIYFLMIRPKVQQEKRHKARLAELRKGDEVVTAGGVVGKIVRLNENELTIKSEETRLVVKRDRIAEVLSGAEPEKKS